MITSITVGSGSNRTKIDMVRDRDQRWSIGSALKKHLFPTPAIFGRAMAQGRKRAAEYKEATA